MRRLFLAGFSAVVWAGVLGAGTGAGAVEAPALEAPRFSFEGVFGTFDRRALRRGLQAYQEICAGCHSLSLVAYRSLQDVGFTADEVKAIAAEATVVDGPNDEGEMFERPGKPSDRFVAPFPNEQMARFANNGALPPDLSVMTKARAGGVDYLYALLTGYVDPPAGVEMTEGMFYNTAFPGNQLAMAPPLSDDAVEYADGTPATVAQIASDLATFLTWAAEPDLEVRKRLGVKVMLFLIILSAMLYAVNRKVWSKLK